MRVIMARARPVSKPTHANNTKEQEDRDDHQHHHHHHHKQQQRGRGKSVRAYREREAIRLGE